MQQTGPSLSSAWDLVLTSSVETKVVLAITAAFSLISWFIIGLKWWQFHRLKKQADRFFSELERTTRLTDAYQRVMKLPPRPITACFASRSTSIPSCVPAGSRTRRAGSP
jgi:biopolymer transport protein ExbB/TolQ